MEHADPVYSLNPAPAQPNQSLIDGIVCLEALAGRREPIGSLALARELGLEPTRVNRLLKTLAHMGLVEQDQRRRYLPGPGIHALAAQALYGSGLIQRALGPLAQLRDLGLPVALGVLWRGTVSYLYHATAQMDPAEGIGRVGVYPVSESGLGQILLADQAARGAPDGALYGVPRDVLLGWHRLGYALTVGVGDGVRTVAVGVGERPYAAVGVFGVFDDDDVPRLVERLRAVAAQIAPATP